MVHDKVINFLQKQKTVFRGRIYSREHRLKKNLISFAKVYQGMDGSLHRHLRKKAD